MSKFIQAVLDAVLPTRWWAAYRRYIRKITTSGYVGERSPVMWFLAVCLLRFWRWVQVGKVTVINKQFLEIPGPMLICANHSSMLDTQLSFPILPRATYFLGAYETLLAGFGLVGVVLTRLGVIPVDRSQGHTVVEPAIKVVTAGDVLALFPEGKISSSGDMLPFKHGPAVIATKAFERLGGKQSVALVPVHFCYHKRDAGSALNYLKMGLRWRGGATITVLPPIYLHELSDRSEENIMCLLRSAIGGVVCTSTRDPEPPCKSADGK